MTVNDKTRSGVFSGLRIASLGVVWGLATLMCAGQQMAANTDAPTLPDAPSARLAEESSSQPMATPFLADQAAGMPHPVAGKLASTIPAGWQAQPLTARDKFLISLGDTYSLQSFAGIFLSAGYSHVTNGEPNYGTDRGAFGERLGAAGARAASENIFAEGILAPLLHEDPRYYVEGNQHNVLHRTLYAITRPLITRTDSGHQTINVSVLGGYAASAALTNVYYPSYQRDAGQTVRTYGGALGGEALGYFFQEFIGDALHAVHLQKRQEP